jgi:hypothetical protein
MIRAIKIWREHYNYLHEQLQNVGVPNHFVPSYQFERWQKKTKRSDTIFILGSGSSVLNLSDKQWQVVKNCNSVGFNFWLIHDFVPDYYFAEIPRDADSAEIMLRNLEQRAGEYKNVFFAFKYRQSFVQHQQYISRLPIKKSLIFCKDIIASNPHDLAASLDDLRKYRIIKFLDLYFTKTASVDLLILWAYKLGFRNIVLLGVDLGTDYFFELNRDYFESKDRQIPSAGQTGTIHKTDDPMKCFGGVPISDVIDVINSVILKPAKVSLYIGSKESRLYPQLALYKW